MVAEARIRIDSAAVRAALDRLAMALPLGGDMTPAMRGLGRYMKTATQLRFREQVSPEGAAWTPSRRAEAEGGQTLSDTRRLARSIQYSADHDRVEIGTNAVYGAIHQFGGTITPKHAKFLAIPITREARAAGSPRRFPRELAVATSLGGQWMLLEPKTGKVHYLLMRRITIPARPYLGASETDHEQMVAILAEHYAGVWKKK